MKERQCLAHAKIFQLGNCRGQGLKEMSSLGAWLCRACEGRGLLCLGWPVLRPLFPSLPCWAAQEEEQGREGGASPRYQLLFFLGKADPPVAFYASFPGWCVWGRYPHAYSIPIPSGMLGNQGPMSQTSLLIGSGGTAMHLCLSAL